MRHAEIIELDDIDIYTWPDLTANPFHIAELDDEWTIGALHGNFMKLLRFLTYHGFITIPKTSYDYLGKIYKKSIDEITINDIIFFKKIVDRNIVIMNLNARVRLLGKILADRGQNDYFLLYLISKIVTIGLKLEITLSDHDFEFICGFEYYIQKNEIPPATTDVQKQIYLNSLFNLRELLDRNWVTTFEIQEHYTYFYAQHLKLISYSINSEENEITLYSHGIIGIETIRHLADYVKVPYEDQTAMALGRTIDRINSRYYDGAIKANIVHRTVGYEAFHLAARAEEYDQARNPVTVLMQNRKLGNLTRPPSKNGYRIYYVYGNSEETPQDPHVFNLHNNLGCSTIHNKGKHKVFCFRPKIDKPYAPSYGLTREKPSRNDTEELLLGELKKCKL